MKFRLIIILISIFTCMQAKSKNYDFIAQEIEFRKFTKLRDPVINKDNCVKHVEKIREIPLSIFVDSNQGLKKEMALATAASLARDIHNFIDNTAKLKTERSKLGSKEAEFQNLNAGRDSAVTASRQMKWVYFDDSWFDKTIESLDHLREQTGNTLISQEDYGAIKEIHTKIVSLPEKFIEGGPRDIAEKAFYERALTIRRKLDKFLTEASRYGRDMVSNHKAYKEIDRKLLSVEKSKIPVGKTIGRAAFAGGTALLLGNALSLFLQSSDAGDSIGDSPVDLSDEGILNPKVSAKDICTHVLQESPRMERLAQVVGAIEGFKLEEDRRKAMHNENTNDRKSLNLTIPKKIPRSQR